jgi:hypothetical protein
VPARLSLQEKPTPDDPWRAQLVALDAAGNALWSAAISRTAGYALAADGCAYYGVGGRKDRVVKLDPRGHEVWSAELPHLGQAGHLLTDGDVVMALGDDRADLLRTSDGSVLAMRAAQEARVDPLGGFALAFEDTITWLSPQGAVRREIQVRSFPPGDPAARRHGGRYRRRPIAFFPDGVLLTGGLDGSLLALDHEGRPRFQLGLRGDVTSIVPAAGGDLVVTAGGTLARVSAGGRVRWETRVSPRNLGPPAALPDGTMVMTADDGALHAVGEGGARLWHEPLGQGSGPAPMVRDGMIHPYGWSRHPPTPIAAAHPPEPVVHPTASLRAEPITLDGKAVRDVQAIVALAPDDVWILAGRLRLDRATRNPRLLHWDGRALAAVAPPKVAFRRERYLEGAVPAAGELDLRSLLRGPKGELLVIAARDDWSTTDESLTDAPHLRAPVVLERAGDGFRERRDLFATLAKLPSTWGYMHGDLHVAAGPRGLLLCARSTCARAGDGPPHIEEVPADGIVAPAFLGDTLLFGAREREPDTSTGSILGGGDTIHARMPGGPLPPVVALAGSGPDDLWALAHDVYGAPTVLVRFDGHTWTDSRAPLPDLDTLVSTGPADVWAHGRGGVLRFSGGRWLRPAGVAPLGGVLSGDTFPIAIAGRDDVWLGRREGLFHLTADPGAGPDLATEPAPIPEASPGRSPRVPVEPPDGAYRLERVTLPVTGEEPMRWAFGAAVAPDGTVWLWDDHRIVEHDGTTGHRLFRTPDDAPLAAHRAVAPAGRGEGFFLAGSLHRVNAGRVADEGDALPDMTAIARGPSGQVWIASASDDDDLPHALVRAGTGTQLVSALPPAAYSDVAVGLGDAWLAGGLTSTTTVARRWPAGEGLLVHFDGHALLRHRAPDGALLAVAAAGPGEAWAAGVGGSMLHAHGAAVEAFHVEPEVILRAVAVSTAHEAFFVGDAATVLHHDGHTLRRIDAAEAGRDGALTGVVAPGAQPGWVVGPAGIFRLSKR